jgi:hypothetical protein
MVHACEVARLKLWDKTKLERHSVSCAVEIPRDSQVFTPPALAVAMVDAVRERNPAFWLEPAAGAGVFLEALRTRGCNLSSVTGLELDRSLKKTGEGFGRTHYGVDSLAWMRRTRAKFDAVIGNPPYVAISDLPSPLRQSALRVPDLEGEPIKPSSNLWSAFVLSAVRVLNQGGALSFVLPASWEYADYARQLREALPGYFETFHTFRSSTPLFREVSEGSVVILGTGFRKAHRYSARVKCAGIDAVCTALTDLKLTPRRSVGVASRPKRSVSGLPLRDFLSLRLGGVTGDTRYFCLTESDRIRNQLPISCLRPIVSRARHLRWATLSAAQWGMLRIGGEKVWLFRPTECTQMLPVVQRYLALEHELGGCARDRFKIQNRVPWYLTPLPSPVHGFLSGMSKRGPRISFACMRGLSATNTLYVVSFKCNLSPGMRRNIALQLLGNKVIDQLYDVQRHYAGGLRKLEPSDILGLRIEDPTTNPVSSFRYEEAFEASL